MVLIIIFYVVREFWEFISGDAQLYIDIIEPLGHQAQERNEEYNNEYGPLVNRLNRESWIHFVAWMVV